MCECVVVTVCSSPQHWINICTSIDHSVEWPQGIISHAATRLSGPLFVIVGGLYQFEMWLCDTTTKLWKNVLFRSLLINLSIITTIILGHIKLTGIPYYYY